MGGNLDPEVLRQYMKDLEKSGEKKGLVHDFINDKIDVHRLDWLVILEFLSTHNISWNNSRMDDEEVLIHTIDTIDLKINLDGRTNYTSGVIIDGSMSFMDDARTREFAEKRRKLLSIKGIKKLIEQFGDENFTFEGFLTFFKDQKQAFEDNLLSIKVSADKVEMLNNETAFCESCFVINFTEERPPDFNPAFYDLNPDIMFYQYEGFWGWRLGGDIIPGNYKIENCNGKITLTKAILI